MTVSFNKLQISKIKATLNTLVQIQEIRGGTNACLSPLMWFNGFYTNEFWHQRDICSHEIVGQVGYKQDQN
jgi:hypothetical protein